MNKEATKKAALLERQSKDPKFLKALKVEEKLLDVQERTTSLRESPIFPEVLQFASDKHKEAGCKYGDEEYTVHLLEVAGILHCFGHHPENNVWHSKENSEKLLKAAYLHDTLEDTKTTPLQIADKFGVGVLMLVENVTDEYGKNRKERFKKTWPKIVSHKLSVILKLADRIANVQRSYDTGDSRYKMYKKEFPEFYDRLYRDWEETAEMWCYLKELMEVEGD